MDVSMNELKRTLIAAGYQQTARVDQPLCFASRGGIIDIYSINSETPVRIEFFDTEIDSCLLYTSYCFNGTGKAAGRSVFADGAEYSADRA